MDKVQTDATVPFDRPVEIEDDYKLTLDADVEDESVLEKPADVKFSITSYGADYTVDTLVKRLESDAFYVPPFQRKFVWSQRHASRFLESLLMGLPVSGHLFVQRACHEQAYGCGWAAAVANTSVFL